MRKILFTFQLLIMFLPSYPQQWNQLVIDQYPFIFGFSFLNSDQGWISARKEISLSDPEYLLFTNDGGDNFELRYTLESPKTFMSFQMIDSLFGVSLVNSDSNFFLRTSDGGYTWEDITDTTFMHYLGPIQYNASIYFINRDIGFIGGNSVIYKTTDGCNSWVKCTVPEIIDSIQPSLNTFLINKIKMFNENYGWAVCNWIADHGFGLKTIDGGLNWTICTSTSFPYMLELDSYDSSTCGMVGNSFFNGVVVLTEDNFNSYSHIHDKYDLNIIANTISYQNDSIIWIAGYPGLIERSINSGETFSDHLIDNIPVENTIINKIEFLDNVGYACGEHYADRFLVKFIDTINTKTNPRRSQSNEIIIRQLQDYYTICFNSQDEGFNLINIISMDGLILQSNRVFVHVGQNEITLNSKSLFAGVYILSIQSKNTNFALKFLKQSR